ncbi:MAG: dockerin type I repeat-containing protein, partial [Prevotella sp.]|nr:dockerin type I repeat-containing protein [Prevotella sp.]
GSIDVVDITMIANHILGNNPENFIFAAADVDADGTVDVNDIISIANIILYGSSSNAKPSMAEASNYLANNVTSNESNGDGFTVKNVSVEKGGTVTVDFELTNAAHDFSGIQFDINLGDGLSFATKSNGKVNVTRGARLEDEDFTLSVAKQEGNQYRALGYYTDGSVIPEKSGTLFTLTLQADESLADGKTFNCQLDNITLSTKNNEKIQQETQTFTVTIGDATGISDLFNEDCTPAVIYDLTGKRIETPAKSGQVIIIKKDGKVVKVFKK